MKRFKPGIEIKPGQTYTMSEKAKEAVFFDKDGEEIGRTSMETGIFTAPKDAVGFKVKFTY